MKRDFIPNMHSDLRTARFTGRGSTMRPEDVLRGRYKEYPRMERIGLPAPGLSIPLGDALKRRRSQRGIVPRASLALEEAGALLSTLGIREDSSRPYPSGGALYPIETYLVGAVEGSGAEVFHYQPEAHALERLWPLPAHFTMYDLAPGADDEVAEPSAVLIFTAMWEKSAAKYGDYSYLLTLLEAGHMAQNVLLAAAAEGVGARPMAGFNDSAVHETLDIDGRDEQAVYAITLYPKKK